MSVKIKNSVFSFPFWHSLVWVQNKYHQHGVFVHTIRVVWELFKAKHHTMLLAGLLHDIGKPFVAYKKDEEDVTFGEYSFTDHEEMSYNLIKKLPFISSYTKNLVRYHYLIRDIKKSKTEDLQRYRKKQAVWEHLDGEFCNDLVLFLECDDKAKGKRRR